MNLDDIVVILTGYSKSKGQLLELIEYYESIGINNIVVSSYTEFMSDSILKKVKFICNDDPSLGGYKITNNHHIDSGHGGGIDGKGIFIYSDINFEVKWGDKSNNLNFQLLTTKRGIELAEKEFPNSKYFLRARSDQRLDEINFDSLIKEVHGFNDDIFEGKILVHGMENTDWYIYDVYQFGHKNDIIRYLDIPFVKNYQHSEVFVCCYYLRKKRKLQFDEAKKYFTNNHKIKIWSYKKNKSVL